MQIEEEIYILLSLVSMQRWLTWLTELTRTHTHLLWIVVSTVCQAKMMNVHHSISSVYFVVSSHWFRRHIVSLLCQFVGKWPCVAYLSKPKCICMTHKSSSVVDKYARYVSHTVIDTGFHRQLQTCHQTVQPSTPHWYVHISFCQPVTKQAQQVP